MQSSKFARVVLKHALSSLCLIAELKTAVKMKSAVSFCAGI